MGHAVTCVDRTHRRSEGARWQQNIGGPNSATTSLLEFIRNSFQAQTSGPKDTDGMTAQDRNEECSSTTRTEKRNGIAATHELPRRERTRWQQGIQQRRNCHTARLTCTDLFWCNKSTNTTPYNHSRTSFRLDFFSISREDHRRCVNRTSDESGWCVWKPASACECSLSERMQKIRFHLNSVTFTGYRSWVNAVYSI